MRGRPIAIKPTLVKAGEQYSGARRGRRKAGATAKGRGRVTARAESEGGRGGRSVSDVFQVLSKKVKRNLRRNLRPLRCLECLGTGTLICRECQGRGKTGGLLVEGESGVECSSCQGEGCIPCRKCEATGISNNWLFQPAENPGWGPRGELEEEEEEEEEEEWF